MCGIAALFEPATPPWLVSTVRAMTRMVRHRGPDGEGFAFYHPASRNVIPCRSAETPIAIEGAAEPPPSCALGLGHRRLAILDLSSAGHQPMSDPTRLVWIVFNGEIYNYLEVREELTRLGHAFHSGTDTEVILAAWREWGDQCLSRFNGMFAFVLFDQMTQRLFAARDRFGVKPLYFWRTPTGGMAFASEIKQFTAHPGWRARLNGQRAYDFLNWGILDHTADTLFAGVAQLRGGEFISAQLGTLVNTSPQRWYKLKPAQFEGDFDEAASQFRELFDNSVKLRLRADVPVGSCLSGGLDSSSIVCTIRAQLGQQAPRLQKTFSAYSDIVRFDERSFIQEVAIASEAESHSVVPSAQTLLAENERLTWHQDEPFGSTSVFAQWCVFRLAREKGVVVMLDGQGADESLGGYHGYFALRLAGLLRQGRWARFWQEASAVRTLHHHSVAQQLKFISNALLPSSVANSLRGLVGRTVDRPNFLDLHRLGAEARSPHSDSVDLKCPVRSFGQSQLSSLNLPMLLHWEDRDSMAHGVEARLPFLDYRLVEFCLGLPEEFKLSEGWTKRVLREGMRNRLPVRIRTRVDKLGFATAEEVWMRETEPAAFRQLVQRAIASADGILTPKATVKAEQILTGAQPFSLHVWRFISFGTWLQRFNISVGYS